VDRRIDGLPVRRRDRRGAGESAEHREGDGSEGRGNGRTEKVIIPTLERGFHK